MNRKQTERFIHKISPTKSIKIKYFSDISLVAPLAETSYLDNTIFLNLAYLKTKKYMANRHVLIKAMLLHEIGHIEGRHCGLKSTQELEAQLFAIRGAAKFKMWKIHRKSIYWLWTWGISKDFIFKNAYDLSLENDECKKYYKFCGYKIP